MQYITITLKMNILLLILPPKSMQCNIHYLLSVQLWSGYLIKDGLYFTSDVTMYY